jgi:RNA polymerase sigma-70 factor (ECF subfamily)
MEDPASIGAAAVSESPDLQVDLERAIAALPPGARMAFVLHEIEGYRHEEIAKQLGVATGTVKAQLHRARKLLIQALNK